MINVKNISKSFGSVKAVDDLSFSVRAGEIVGLLGPNGAGKTTTMRLMAGFISPDAGDIDIGGVSVAKNAVEVRRKIGYLPENNPLYKDMLVSEALRFSCELKGILKERQKSAVEFSVDATDIGNVYNRAIGELSKGYKQRVGMAIALLAKPEVLILDEPTEGLDPNQRTEIRALIKDFAKDRTIVMSTHVMQEASAVCDRMLIIGNGALVAEGTTEELSRLAQKERVIVVEMEGENVEAAFEQLEGVRHVDIEKISGTRIRATLAVSKEAKIQPEISRRAHDHNWTIWHFAETEHKLEDIFHILTKNK